MKHLALALVLLSSSTAFAGGCDNLYPNGKVIKVQQATELCSSFFVTVYDTHNRAALFSSELLKHDSGVGTVERKDSFRPDDRIAKSPTNRDYLHTGFDRGHLAPADDASTDQEMYDTFLLTNMTPQEPTVNRNSWAHLEEKVRKMFDQAKSDVYILTIADYTGSTKKMNNVPIPTGYWKVVYIDGSKQFFYAPNVPNGKVVQKSGVDVNSLIK